MTSAGSGLRLGDAALSLGDPFRKRSDHVGGCLRNTPSSALAKGVGLRGCCPKAGREPRKKGRTSSTAPLSPPGICAEWKLENSVLEQAGAGSRRSQHPRAEGTHGGRRASGSDAGPRGLGLTGGPAAADGQSMAHRTQPCGRFEPAGQPDVSARFQKRVVVP